MVQIVESPEMTIEIDGVPTEVRWVTNSSPARLRVFGRTETGRLTVVGEHTFIMQIEPGSIVRANGHVYVF